MAVLSKSQFMAECETVLKPEADVSGYAAVWLDIDNFKSYNERFGYTAGDEFLSWVGILISEEFDGMPVGHFHEDHYAVLAKKDDALAKIESINSQLKPKVMGMAVKISAGIYVLEAGEKNMIIACDRARLACSTLKHQYSTNVRFYDASLGDDLTTEQDIINNFDAALENGCIQVYYQPIVRTVTGKICGAEALARWDDPERGIIAPDRFVPILEKHGLISKLDIYMMKKIAENYGKMRLERRPMFPVSLNLSRLDFETCDIFSEVDQIRFRAGMDINMLSIEITESALNTVGNVLETGINKFLDNGYQVWLDDFGSGYSALDVLKTYRFSVIKFDMNFLNDFDIPEKQERAKIILSQTMNMAKQLGITTLTEGVENESQLHFLRTAGCEMVQGYLYSTPVPLDEFLRLDLEVEDLGETSYYENIGRIEMSNSGSSDSNPGFVKIDPTAIVETRRGFTNFLTWNDKFEKIISDFGFDDIKECELAINAGRNTVKYKIMEFTDSLCYSREAKRLDFMIQGSLYCVVGRHISDNRFTGASTFLIIITPASEASFGAIDNYNFAMKSVYGLFERADVWDLDDNVVSECFVNDMSLDVDLAGRKISDAAAVFAARYIHDDDKGRFVEFTNVNTIVSRVMGMRKEYVCEHFRTKTEDGQFRERVYLIVPQITSRMKKATLVISNLPDNLSLGITENASKTTEKLSAVPSAGSIDGSYVGKNYRDSLTGFMNISGLRRVLTGYTDDYERGGRDFEIYNIKINNFNEFELSSGNGFSDILITTIASAISSVISEDDIAVRVSDCHFVVLHRDTEGMSSMTLRFKLTEKIASVYTVGPVNFRPMAAVKVTRFSEMSSLDRMLIFSSHYLKQQSGMSGEELELRMRMLRSVFPVVRIVNPDIHREMTMNREQEICETKHMCYGLLGRSEACRNCISAKVWRTHGSVSKFDIIDGEISYMISQYLIVDDKPVILELIKDASDTVEATVLDRIQSNEEFENYIEENTDGQHTDAETGLKNRLYFDEQYALRGIQALAVISVDNLSFVRNTYGAEAAGKYMKEIADRVSREISGNYELMSFGGRELTLVSDFTNFDKFCEILHSIYESVPASGIDLQTEVYPRISVSGLFGHDTAKRLLVKALQELDIACREKNETGIFLISHLESID